VGEAARLTADSTDPFNAWIESCSSPERRQRIEGFIRICDSIAERSSYAEVKRLKFLFQQASHFEYCFWDDAYHYSSSQNVLSSFNKAW
jgi:thiaminase